MSSTIKQYINQFGVDYVRAVLALPPMSTQKSRIEAIKKLPKIKLAQTKQLAVMLAIRESRHSVQVRRPLPKKPEITLKERLEKKRLAATKKTYLQTYRSGVNDEESVVLTDDLTAVGVYQTSSTDWSKYRGAYRGWACNYNETKIVVPARRHERVVKQGLDVIDGMMTLDAQKLTGVADIELYAAVWVVQKRGNNVETVRGFIAKRSAVFYHADTAEKAVAGVSKKAEFLYWQSKIQCAPAEALLVHKDIIVKLSDVFKCGACVSGVKNWCARVGLDYEAGSAKLSEIFDGYKLVPAPEARLAMINAIRRNRLSI